MTEAPIRAMDEFDVFMVISISLIITCICHMPFLDCLAVYGNNIQDAVSRKISLDTLVDFALEKGSQWMFITPHDIR